MARKQKLRAPTGTDEANFGQERFPVNPIDHTIEVPEEAVAALVSVGGFEVIDEPAPEIPDGHCVMRHIAPPASCSFMGQSYNTDEQGCITVPLAAVGDLQSHGFVLVDH